SPYAWLTRVLNSPLFSSALFRAAEVGRRGCGGRRDSAAEGGRVVAERRLVNALAPAAQVRQRDDDKQRRHAQGRQHVQDVGPFLVKQEDDERRQPDDPRECYQPAVALPALFVRPGYSLTH